MKTIGSVLYEYLQKVQSLIAPAIAAVFLLGVFNKRITPKAGQWGFIIGALIGFVRLCLMIFDPGSHYDKVAEKLITDPTLRSGIFTVLNINWLHFCIGLFFFTMLLMVVISFFTPKASAGQLQGLTYFSQSPEQVKETRKSWSAVDIITSLMVLGSLYCILYLFLVE